MTYWVGLFSFFLNAIAGLLSGNNRPFFVDVASQIDLEREEKTDPGSLVYGFTPMSAGASWVDYDNDGWMDLFLPDLDSDKSNKLYKNMGDGTFKDVTEFAGLNYKGNSWSGTFGDFDNDGNKDLYITNYGSIGNLDSSGEANLLYKNMGDGTFKDVTIGSGVGSDGHSTGATWADFDNDGDLDLYVANYGVTDSDGLRSENNHLYVNDGQGVFTDEATDRGVADQAQITELPEERGVGVRTGMAFQPIWFDYDNDGYQDLFVASDFGISPLFRNAGNGRFTDVTDQTGLNVFGTGMGVAVGDYDNDGFLDLYVTNYDHNYLWKNNQGKRFDELASEAGVDNASVGWGASFSDFDNDGDLDLMIANGAEGPKWRDLSLREENSVNVFYENVGNGKFLDKTSEVGLNDNSVSMGLAVADYDKNGFLDLFLVRALKSNSLYKNMGNKNNWVAVNLKRNHNFSTVGARVLIDSSLGLQVREVAVGSSYLSQNGDIVYFGLGKDVEIKSGRVVWPGGNVQILDNLMVGSINYINESDDN